MYEKYHDFVARPKLLALLSNALNSRTLHACLRNTKISLLALNIAFDCFNQSNEILYVSYPHSNLAKQDYQTNRQSYVDDASQLTTGASSMLVQELCLQTEAG